MVLFIHLLTTVGWAGASPEPIAPGARVQGELTDADETALERPARDLYVFRGSAGDRILATMDAGSFEGRVYIGILYGDRFASACLQEQDGEVSRAFYVLPEDGDYAIAATSAAAGGRGSYVVEVGPAPPPPTNPKPVRIRAGDTVLGTLDETDARRFGGERFDDYVYVAKRGEAVAFEARADGWSPGLVVGRIDGDWITPVVLTFPEDGRYVIRVFSSRLGAYELSHTPR